MRLSAEQHRMIIEAFDFYLQNAKAELRLFGSRVDDSKRGGDIDLLLVFPDKKTVLENYDKKIKIQARLLSLLEEQKIDIVLTYVDALTEDPLLKIMNKASVLLKRWDG